MQNNFVNFVKMLTISLLLSMQVVGQAPYFISLDGRQFKNGPDDFYPLVCNYSFEIIFNSPNTSTNPPLSSLYLSPSRNYGIGTTLLQTPNNNFDFDNSVDALAQIDADFNRIKNMGFNAIRTHGITATIKPQLAATFYYDVVPNYHSTLIQYPSANSETIGTNFDYATNPVLAKLWDFYDVIFTKADVYGLKVLLDVSSGTIGSHFYPSHHTAFKNYLTALANHFKNNKALMAYVVIEEPDMQYFPESNGNTGNKKEAICNYTTEWYDAIKGTVTNPNDPNHLITASCVSVGTVFEWDPGVMKLDFFSPHIYPGTQSFEGNSVLEPYYRNLGYIQWLRDNCPMPWITGELSFSACDDSYFGINPSWVPSSLNPPDDWGTLSDQYWFADNILDEIRNAGGSGFSWWNYQENWWPIPGEEGMGLIDHLGNDKPVVAAFTGYLDPITKQPPPQSNFNAPVNYYNPYNTGSAAPGYNFNTANSNALIGDVYDSNTGAGIKDAYVFAWNWLSTFDPNPQIQGDENYSYSGMHTFTDVNGHFQLVPFNFEQPSIINAHRIVAIRVSAVGAEKANDGLWGDNVFTSSTILLDRHINQFDAMIQNITVNPGVKNFRGRNTLTSNNVTFLSATKSEITAKNEINIHSNFDANVGSDVHIFTSEFQECPSYQNFAKLNGSAETDLINVSEDSEKSIEVQFTSKSIDAYLEVKPNPTKGIFNIAVIGISDYDTKSELKIVDMLGNLVYQTTILKTNFSLDISFLPNGIYNIMVNSTNNLFQKRIIKI